MSALDLDRLFAEMFTASIAIPIRHNFSYEYQVKTCIVKVIRDINKCQYGMHDIKDDCIRGFQRLSTFCSAEWAVRCVFTMLEVTL